MSSISDIFGGSSGGTGYQPGYVGTYIPQNTNAADTDWLNAINAIQANNGQIGTASQGIVNNQYAAPAQNASNTAGVASGAVGGADLANANLLSTTGNALIPYATQALAQGFDPQSALYNQNLATLKNQVNAQNSASGIGTSPVGAQIANNDIGNFLINWNAQKLANEGTAANTASTINQTGASDLNTASNLGTQGVTAVNQAGQIPYSTSINNLINIMNALQTSNAANQGVAADTQSYLNGATSASTAANNAANTNFQNTLAASQDAGSLFSSLPSLSSLTSIFGGGSGAGDAATSVASAAEDPNTLADLALLFA